MEINQLVFEAICGMQTESLTLDGKSLRFATKDPRPDSRELISGVLKPILVGGYRMLYAKGTKKVTIYRFLLGKLVYDQEGLFLEEFLAILDLRERLQNQSEKDPDFRKKYGQWLVTTDLVISILYQALYFPILLTPQSKEFLKNFLKPLLPGPTAYFAYKKDPKIGKPFVLKLRQPVATTRRLQTTRRIGVGYRDKGQLRDPALNGLSYRDLMKASYGYSEESFDSTMNQFPLLNLLE